MFSYILLHTCKIILKAWCKKPFNFQDKLGYMRMITFFMFIQRQKEMNWTGNIRLAVIALQQVNDKGLQKNKNKQTRQWIIKPLQARHNLRPLKTAVALRPRLISSLWVPDVATILTDRTPNRATLQQDGHNQLTRMGFITTTDWNVDAV